MRRSWPAKWGTSEEGASTAYRDGLPDRVYDGMPGGTQQGAFCGAMADSSIDILVPEAAPTVGEWYGRTQAALDGVPPHLTLLWPWRPSPGPADLEAVANVARTAEPFTFRFERCGRFPGVLYLAPEPDDEIRVLMTRLATAFPDTPPFAGEFSEPVPHLTVAKTDDPMEMAAIEEEVLTRLTRAPLAVTVSELSVSVEGLGPRGLWGVTARYRLGETS